MVFTFPATGHVSTRICRDIAIGVELCSLHDIALPSPAHSLDVLSLSLISLPSWIFYLRVAIGRLLKPLEMFPVLYLMVTLRAFIFLDEGAVLRPQEYPS